MARVDVKKAVFVGGIVVLSFLLVGVVAYFSFSSNKEADVLINQSFRNPVGSPSVKGPSGPPPIAESLFPLDSSL